MSGADVRLPAVGTPVSVHVVSSWLDGVVVESSHASGEFLVEFDDEDEVQAWCSVSQPWRCLRPPNTEEEASLVVADGESAGPLSSSEPVLPLPGDGAIEELPLAAASDDTQWSRVVQAEFRQLYDASLRTDGHGAELAHDTLARFEKLHAATLGDG